MKKRDELVFRVARARDIPVMVTYAGGYARNVEDTVTIHCNTVIAAKEVFAAQELSPPDRLVEPTIYSDGMNVRPVRPFPQRALRPHPQFGRAAADRLGVHAQRFRTAESRSVFVLQLRCASSLRCWRLLRDCVRRSKLARRIGEAKDTLRNIRETKEFVVNIVTYELAEAMNLTSGEYDASVNEFELAQIASAPSRVVKVRAWPRRR